MRQQSWRRGAAEAEGLEVFVVNPTIILGDARYAESSGMVYRRVAKGQAPPPGRAATVLWGPGTFDPEVDGRIGRGGRTQGSAGDVGRAVRGVFGQDL